jgi:undecaprenyl-diphosphatase
LKTAAVASGTVASLLTVDALLHEESRFDVWAINNVQSLDLPYLHSAITAVSTLTSSTWAVALWAFALLAFVLSRRWLPALAALTLPLGGILNQIIGEYLVGRTRPDPDVVTRTIPDIQAASFPSGHVMGAVMFYGMLIFLARRIQNAVLRRTIQVSSAAIIASVGFARVWEGAHWPTDVLGAYAWGGLFLVALFAAYNRIEAAAGHLPFIHAGAVAHDESLPHAHALTSVVTFNGDRVTKVYNPGFLPRALYWLSFQARFPYERNEAALRAAMHRRNMVALLTEYWYGTPRVARVTSIDRVAGQLAITSEFVDGHAPSDRAAAKTFLRDLRARFEAAGLPTWQIDPRQPRAVDNVLETPSGYTIVDLESGLVSPLASLKTWARAIRRGQVPLFDTVFYDVTRAYVAGEAGAMRATQGDAWFAELQATLDAAESATTEWYASEPRIPSIVADVRSWKPRIEKATASGQEKALGWMTASVATWEAEGRISRREASELRAQMDTPQFQAVIPHLGAHVVISIVLRFPFGSIARAGWTTWALAAASIKLLLRRSDRRAWKQAWSIHNPLVIALAAIPGFGTFAYMAAGPIRSNRLLARVMVDAVMHKLPWRLYERSGMRRVVVIGRSAGSRAAAGSQTIVPFPVSEPAHAPALVPTLAASHYSTTSSLEAAAWD